jgi:DNA invertase Pin-like site-specific DNA recombinase
MVVYGYVRVSAADQNEDRQLIAMSELNIPAARVFTDKQSGKDFNRPAYKALLSELRPGDLLYVKSIDRLGRDYDEVQSQWRVLTKERGIDIAVIDMPILDTRNGRDLMGTFLADTVLTVLSFVAQNERDTTRKRQAEGIAAARIRGVHMGRPAKRLPENFGELASQWERGKLTTTELILRTGLTETTLYRRLREHRITKEK